MITEQKRRSIEGHIVTGRKLAAYESALGLRRSLFKGQKVLNYGCGASNISGELKRHDELMRSEGRTDEVIDASVIELDLKYDPIFGDEKWHAKSYVVPLFTIADFFLKKNSDLHKRLVEWKRREADVADRDIVQANGRHLPFADGTFDTTVTQLANYQTLMPKDKEQIFRELLRVSNAVHASPVSGQEFDILARLAAETGYEIVHAGNRVPKIENVDDYERYKKLFSFEERVKRPKTGEPEIAWLGNTAIHVGIVPGSLVILRRKDS